jgi:diadenosine tetraphosphate (Ap4A) HIT family hydrolase
LTTAWEDVVRGVGCPLCAPRPQTNEYRVEIARLTVSSLYLFRDQRFRGYCLLIFDPRHVAAIDDLSEEEYVAFMADLRRSGRAVRAALRPDHMNYELLGNSTPHAHWHIVPRYRTDPRWGQPIWEGWPRNEFNVNRQALSGEEERQLVELIRSSLAAGGWVTTSDGSRV